MTQHNTARHGTTRHGRAGEGRGGHDTSRAQSEPTTAPADRQKHQQSADDAVPSNPNCTHSQLHAQTQTQTPARPTPPTCPSLRVPLRPSPSAGSGPQTNHLQPAHTADTHNCQSLLAKAGRSWSLSWSQFNNPPQLSSSSSQEWGQKVLSKPIQHQTAAVATRAGHATVPHQHCHLYPPLHPLPTPLAPDPPTLPCPHTPLVPANPLTAGLDV